MNEKNKKLAEWAGIEWKITERTYNRLEQDIWVYPDGTIKDEPPNFTQSLDDCFKWLVPDRISEITFMFASNCVSCDIEDLEVTFFEGHVNTETIKEAWSKSALALCLAIEKKIDGEKK